MPTTLREPIIPQELLPLWDDHAREAHARLADMSIDQVIGAMPNSQFHTSDSARWVDLSPSEDHDRTKAVAFIAPYTNGWMPHIAIRAQMLQDVLPEPTRVIVFPDNTLFETAYVLTDRERLLVGGGDSGPIANKLAFTLGHLGIKEVHILGGSEGATVGAAFLRTNAQKDKGRFKIANSGLIEPPNCLDRGIGGLEKAFFETKMRDLTSAVCGSAIPALTEVQRAGSRLGNISQSLRIGRDYIVSKIDKNMRAVKSGMATDSFSRDIYFAGHSFGTEYRIGIIGGGSSAIFPRGVQQQLKDFFTGINRVNADFLVIEGEKHTMSDNVVANALIGRWAITGELSQAGL